MEPTLFVRGLILGFTIAAAVGPISLLVIRRTLAEGRLVGIVSGMGVATADGTYGAIAAFGLTAITELLVDWRRALGLVGGAFLLWVAWRTFRSVPGDAATTERWTARADRRLPQHARADADQPDDDPLVRGTVRRPRGDRRGRGGRGVAHAGRARRVGRLVGRARDRGRRLPVAPDRRPDSGG